MSQTVTIILSTFLVGAFVDIGFLRTRIDKLERNNFSLQLEIYALMSRVNMLEFYGDEQSAEDQEQ